MVREPNGGLILSASPENRSALIVNSADVTDPGTGQFGLTVPIDSVEVLNVYQTAYLSRIWTIYLRTGIRGNQAGR